MLCYSRNRMGPFYSSIYKRPSISICRNLSLLCKYSQHHPSLLPKILRPNNARTTTNKASNTNINTTTNHHGRLFLSNAAFLPSKHNSNPCLCLLVLLRLFNVATRRTPQRKTQEDTSSVLLHHFIYWTLFGWNQPFTSCLALHRNPFNTKSSKNDRNQRHEICYHILYIIPIFI